LQHRTNHTVGLRKPDRYTRLCLKLLEQFSSVVTRKVEVNIIGLARTVFVLDAQDVFGHIVVECKDALIGNGSPDAFFHDKNHVLMIWIKVEGAGDQFRLLFPARDRLLEELHIVICCDLCRSC